MDNNLLNDLIQTWVNTAKWSPSGGNLQLWEVGFTQNFPEVQIEIKIPEATFVQNSYSDSFWVGATMGIGTFTESISQVILSQGHQIHNIQLKIETIKKIETLFVYINLTMNKAELLENSQAKSEENEIIKNIKKRVTNRGLYLKKQIPQDIQSIIQAQVSIQENLKVQSIQTQKEEFIRIMSDLMYVRMRNKYLYEELMSEVYDSKENLKKTKGIPLNTLGLPDFVLAGFKMSQKKKIHFTSRWMNALSLYYSTIKPLRNSGEILVLSHQTESLRGWFEIGKTFQSIWLKYNKNKIGLQPYALNLLLYNWHKNKNTQIFDAKDLEILTQSQILLFKNWNIDVTRPCMIFRIGYPTQNALASPRAEIIAHKNENSFAQTENQIYIDS